MNPDKVDGQPIGSISALRSRFENLAPPGSNLSGARSPAAPKSRPDISRSVSKAAVSSGTQTPVKDDSSSIISVIDDTITNASTQLTAKKKPPPPPPPSLSRDRRRSSDLHIPRSTPVTRPVSPAPSQIVTNAPPEDDEHDQTVKSVSQLRSRFNIPTQTDTSTFSRPPSRPHSIYSTVSGLDTPAISISRPISPGGITNNQEPTRSVRKEAPPVPLRTRPTTLDEPAASNQGGSHIRGLSMKEERDILRGGLTPTEPDPVRGAVHVTQEGTLESVSGPESFGDRWKGGDKPVVPQRAHVSVPSRPVTRNATRQTDVMENNLGGSEQTIARSPDTFASEHLSARSTTGQSRSLPPIEPAGLQLPPPQLPPRIKSLDLPGNSQHGTQTPVLPPRNMPPPPIINAEDKERGQVDDRVAHPPTFAPPNLPDRSRSASISVRSGTAGRSGRVDLTQDDGYVAPPPPVRLATAPVAPQQPNRPAKTGSMDREDSEEDDEYVESTGQGAGTGLTRGMTMRSGNRARAEYPDSTRASRRAPDFVPRQRITSSHQIQCFAVFGYRLAVGSHNVKVYDLTLGDGQPIFICEPRHTGLDFRGKDARVTAMSYRAASNKADEGRYLWCGTNAGHLWELDTTTGEVSDVKPGLHGNTVTHIFRRANWMITLDESGKAHVFGPYEGNDEHATKRQTSAPCRSVRTADRQNFAAMLGNQLWTASGPAARSTTNSALKGPTVRVYEPTQASSSTAAGRTTFTSEWTGAVTAASFNPSDPNLVYLGHEGGFISVFNRESLECLSVLKISPTDVLGLECVGSKLWAGSRTGTINVYDTSTTPWTTTNTWNAHPEHPIIKIHVDPSSIDQSGRYAVWTWARDALHAWDGLLSVDWIETQMHGKESEYCSFRDLKILISSWNIDSSKPGDLTGSYENQSFFEQCLSSVESPDIIVFGWQEMIDLNNRKLTAKTMLFGSKSKQDGRGSADGVSPAYRQWQEKLQIAVRMNTPPECNYTMLDSESLVGLMTVVFVKSSLRDSLRDVAITTIKRGIGGVYGNKGAVVARMTIDDSSLCFINVHLAAGQSHKAARNADVAGILEEKAVFSPSDARNSYVNGGDGSAILDHETVFLNGDLNYRIDQRRDNVISSVNAGDLDFLLEYDQLRTEMLTNTTFRLRAFHEAPITFAPTYKYNPNSTDYDSSEKKRIPAWCDRILWKSRVDDHVRCLSYRRYEPTVSDHRPVSGGFSFTVKAIDSSRYLHVRSGIEKQWYQREGDMMRNLSNALDRMDRE